MKRLLALLLPVLPLLAPAQTPLPRPARHATVLDLTAASGPTLNAASAAAWRLWGLDKAGRLQAGLGLRASHYFADAATFDSQNQPADVTLAVREPRTLALNLALHLRARVAGPVSLGFNLDAVGVSFGPDRPGERTYPPPPPGPPQPVPPSPILPGWLPGPFSDRTRPVSDNLLLGGLRDRGSLNSELYGSVALPGGFSVRAGYCHLVTAQTTDGYRFRRFRNLASVGVSWQLP